MKKAYIYVTYDSCAISVVPPFNRSYHKIQIFSEFMNFYHHFIQRYFKITASLTDLLKDSKNSKKIDAFK